MKEKRMEGKELQGSSKSSGRQHFDASFLEPWHGELALLAETRMGPALQKRVDPQDVAQDSLVKALESWEKFRGNPEHSRELAGWLRQIVVNEVVNCYRYHSSQGRDIKREMNLLSNPDTSCQGVDAYIACLDSGPQESVLRRERAEKLNEALDALPEDERVAVVSRYFNKMKIKEITKLLSGIDPGMTEKMASDRVFRGLKKLSEHFKGDEFWASRIGNFKD